MNPFCRLLYSVSYLILILLVLFLVDDGKKIIFITYNTVYLKMLDDNEMSTRLVAKMDKMMQIEVLEKYGIILILAGILSQNINIDNFTLHF